MKRLSMIMMCLFALMAASLSVKAQEVTITLYPGWNWISYPMAEVLDIGTALGDFAPVNGDMIKSQFSNSSYVNGQWRGGVTHFMPGWGYKYFSDRTEIVSFVFGEPAPQLIVTTAEPTEITAISAISGGSLSSTDGSYIVVLEKGICWATHPNPTVMNDFHTENGNGINSFTAEMTDLDLNTVYYLRAYAVTEGATTYGEEMNFCTRDGIPVVTTDSVTDIWSYDAVCGGEVTDNGGLDVISRGVCWSTSPNPIIDDSNTINGSGLGAYTSRITGIVPNTTYYIRAYASTSHAIAYGEEMSFTTEEDDGNWVDLGLPSGKLWATFNVGANVPEDYGDYFAWAETSPKDTYNWSNYQYCNGSENTLTKYCDNPDCGQNGFVDYLGNIQPEDDPASVIWGRGWRTPTQTEWRELIDNTSRQWTTINGVHGMLFTGSNGNTLFLPAAGSREESELYDAGVAGRYWSKNLRYNYPKDAMAMGFGSSSCTWKGIMMRPYGLAIRPIHSGF